MYSEIAYVVLFNSSHLAFKQPLVAAKTLYFTAKSEYIYAATYICSKFNLKDEAETYGYICMEKCLSEKDWPTFYKVIELVESLKVSNMPIYFLLFDIIGFFLITFLIFRHERERLI